MALTDLVSIRVTDDEGNRGNINAHLPAGLSTADVEAWLAVVAADLDVMTAGVLGPATIRKSLTLPGGLKSTATAGTQIPEGVNMGFVVANSNYAYALRIPAFNESLIVNGVVDDTDLNVISFLNLMITGDGTVAPVNEHGLDLQAHIDSYRSFRKG